MIRDRMHSVAYRVRITRSWTRFSLCCQMLPSALYYLLVKPAHRAMAEIDPYFLQDLRFKKRIVSVLYDVMHHLLCESYSEITGLKVLPATGQLMNLLIDLTKYLDHYLDTQITGSAPPLEQMLAIPPLHQRIEILRRYLRLFGCEKPVMAYLRETFMIQYANYTQKLTISIRTMQFEDLLATAQLDSGIWRSSMIEIVALFNAQKPESRAFEDFYLFGMLGKFADDMFDLCQDVKNGQPNLIYALLNQHPDELAALQFVISKQKRPGAAWWKKHCPNTYNRFFDYVEDYYKQITSKKLRFLSDVITASSLIGIDARFLS